MLEFDPSILCGESPIGPGVLLVAIGLPGRDLGAEEGFVGPRPIETLRGKNTQFGLCQVEPAAVLWGVMPLEPFDQTAGFIGRECFVKGSWRLRIEIVLDQHDFLSIREVGVRQLLENIGVIDGRVAIRDFHMPPALQRSEHNEEIGPAVTLVFVIITRRLSWLHPDRGARFFYKLLGRLVNTNQRIVGIVRSMIDFQHIFHRSDKGAVRLGWDHPLLFEMGLENVFFKTRPIVLSLALSTILRSTTFSSSNRNVHRTRPAGGSEQAKAISFASFSPSKIRGTAGMARCLRLRTASKPSSTSCLRTR